MLHQTLCLTLGNLSRYWSVIVFILFHLSVKSLLFAHLYVNSLCSLLILFWVVGVFFFLLIPKISVKKLDIISTFEPDCLAFLKGTEYKIYDNHIWFLHLVKH